MAKIVINSSKIPKVSYAVDPCAKSINSWTFIRITVRLGTFGVVSLVNMLVITLLMLAAVPLYE